MCRKRLTPSAVMVVTHYAPAWYVRSLDGLWELDRERWRSTSSIFAPCAERAIFRVFISSRKSACITTSTQASASPSRRRASLDKVSLHSALSIPLRSAMDSSSLSSAVLLVTYLFHPINVLTAHVFLNGDVRHSGGR
jgi:hypothetical protein